jgi:hypothetical protein
MQYWDAVEIYTTSTLELAEYIKSKLHESRFEGRGGGGASKDMYGIWHFGVHFEFKYFCEFETTLKVFYDLSLEKKKAEVKNLVSLSIKYDSSD